MTKHVVSIAHVDPQAFHKKWGLVSGLAVHHGVDRSFLVKERPSFSLQKHIPKLWLCRTKLLIAKAQIPTSGPAREPTSVSHKQSLKPPTLIASPHAPNAGLAVRLEEVYRDNGIPRKTTNFNTYVTKIKSPQEKAKYQTERNFN